MAPLQARGLTRVLQCETWAPLTMRNRTGGWHLQGPSNFHCEVTAVLGLGVPIAGCIVIATIAICMFTKGNVN